MKTIWFLVLLTICSFTFAEVFIVNSGDDDGPGTLREAIENAVNGDDIIFDIDNKKPRIKLKKAIIIDVNITIDGGGSGVTVDGGNKTIFENNANVTISNLILTKGQTAIVNNDDLELLSCIFVSNKAGKGDNAGAIHNTSGATLEIANCLFEKNSANKDGGAIFNEGNILQLTNSTFSKNKTKDNGGAIANEGDIDSMENCTFEKNSAINGGAITSIDSITISKSTFVKNSAKNSGGCIFVEEGITRVTNCTFSGNKASQGGAIEGRVGDVLVASSTFFGNKAKQGGAVFSFEDGVTLEDSLLAGNKAKEGSQIFGNFTSLGFNLFESPAGASGFDGDNDILALDGKVTAVISSKLADNGGFTLTHALVNKNGNPALDGANENSTEDEDQRGFTRDDERNDIGAFEVGANPVASLNTTARGVMVKWQGNDQCVGFHVWRKLAKETVQDNDEAEEDYLEYDDASEESEEVEGSIYHKISQLQIMASQVNEYEFLDVTADPNQKYIYKIECITRTNKSCFLQGVGN